MDKKDRYSSIQFTKLGKKIIESKKPPKMSFEKFILKKVMGRGGKR